MKQVSNFKLPGYSERFQVKDIIARDMLLDVTQLGVDNTGEKAISDTVNQIIADHPHSTLYFKSGEYEVDKTIILPSANAKRVHILADKTAYFRKTKTTNTVDCMFQIGDDWDSYNRQGDRPLTFVDGGVYNGQHFEQVFKIWKTQCVYLQNFTIIHAEKRGIYLANHMYPDAFSCNAYVQNGKIQGYDGKTTEEGILNESYDNSYSHLMVDGFKIGVSNTGGGGVYDDIHVLGIYYPTPPEPEDFNNRTGFYLPNDCRMVNCYADCVGLGFGISASVHADNTFYYNYWNEEGMTPKAFSYSMNSMDYGQAIFDKVTIGCVDGVKTTLLENNLGGAGYQNGFTPIFKNLRLLNAKINNTLQSNVSRTDEMFKMCRQDTYKFSPIANNAFSVAQGTSRLLGIVTCGRDIQNLKCLLNGGFIDIDFVAFDSNSMRVYRDESVFEKDIIVEFKKLGNNIAVVLTNQGEGNGYLICCDGMYFSSGGNGVSMLSYPMTWITNTTADTSTTVLYTIHAFNDKRPMTLSTGQGVTALSFNARGFSSGNNGILVFSGNNNDGTGIVFSLLGFYTGYLNVKHLGTVEPDFTIDYSSGLYTINVTGLSEYTTYTIQTLTDNLYLPH